MTFLRTALLILRKDVAIELKSYELVTTTLFFAISCVAIFSFAFVNEGRAAEGAAAGILWIAIAFSGTLALGRTFERERYGDTIKALLIAPRARAAVYVGKLLGILVLMAATEVVLVPMIAFLFNAPFLSKPMHFFALLALGTIGYASVGTLFAAMLMRARTRDVMLPILLYPITVPVIIAGVRGTAALIANPVDEPIAMLWISMLGFFDVVFVTLCLWTFEPLMTE